MDSSADAELIHYVPIATTVLAAIFAFLLLRRYGNRKSGPHLLWWGAGIIAYGIGTALESSITLLGNSIFQTKAWYIAGALLGGYPLAQGSAYLLASRKFANRLTAITLPFIAIVSLAVILSPVNYGALESFRPTGSVIGWTYIRWMTPIINIYAVIFLVGGAFYSAYRFWKKQGVGDGARAFGNILIAVGGIMPGIGGTLAKTGFVEALYLGEFVGLLFIWAGFTVNIRAPRVAQASAPSVAVSAAA